MKRIVFLTWLAALGLLLAGCQSSAPTPTAVALATTAAPATTVAAATVTPDAATPTLAATTSPTAAAMATESQSTAVASATLPPDTPTLAATATDTATATTPPTSVATSTADPDINVVIDVPGVTLPPGFSIRRFATVLRPTGLAFDENGRLFVTTYENNFVGFVRILTDADADGYADDDVVFVSRLDTPLGVAIRPGTEDVYVSSMGKITMYRDLTDDRKFDTRQDIVTDLPFGLHQNDNLEFGPDGMLYIGIGSTCDVCVEGDPRSATIMRFDPDTGAGEVIATGLRNPYDIAFHPTTGDLFATDNGRDDLGDDVPSEELNHIVPGADYGWPDCWDDLQGLGCSGTTPAIAFFQAHSSVNSIDFYTGTAFPAQYRGSLFAAVFGSFIVDVPAGIMQVVVTPNGDSYTTEQRWFAQWPDARPLGMVVGPDGALYVGDYLGDAIYRISYGDG